MEKKVQKTFVDEGFGFKARPTAMAWTTEKDLRLFILSKFSVKAVDIANLYAELEKERAERGPSVEVDAKKMVAQ